MNDGECEFKALRTNQNVCAHWVAAPPFFASDRVQLPIPHCRKGLDCPTQGSRPAGQESPKVTVVIYKDSVCNTKITLRTNDVIWAVGGWLDNSDSGDKLFLEITEMTEEEFDGIPESEGC